MKTLLKYNYTQKTIAYIFLEGAPQTSTQEVLENYKQYETKTYKKGSDFRTFLQNDLGYDTQKHSPQQIYKALRKLHCNLPLKTGVFYEKKLPRNLPQKLQTNIGVKFVKFPQETLSAVIDGNKEKEGLKKEIYKVPDVLKKYPKDLQKILMDMSKKDYPTITYKASEHRNFQDFMNTNKLSFLDKNEENYAWEVMTVLYKLKGKRFPKSYRHIPDGFKFIDFSEDYKGMYDEGETKKPLNKAFNLRHKQSYEKFKKELTTIPGTKPFFDKELPHLSKHPKLKDLGITKVYIDHSGEGNRTVCANMKNGKTIYCEIPHDLMSFEPDKWSNDPDAAQAETLKDLRKFKKTREACLSEVLTAIEKAHQEGDFFDTPKPIE